MAVEFRCEKCGKLITVDAKAGAKTPCPQCGKRIRVPEGLASLPRPQVPGGQGGDKPAGEGDEPEGEEEEEQLEESTAVMTAMANIMPWVISAFFHLGLFLIMAFIVMFVRYSADEREVPIPDATLSDNPGGRMDPGERTIEETAKVHQRTKTYSERNSAIESEVETEKEVQLIGLSGAAGGKVNFGVRRGTSGVGPASSFFGSGGNAYHVVYVVDRSGSMYAGGVWEIVQREMLMSIAKLKPIQDFHVILFAEGPPLEPRARRLVAATNDYKEKVAVWLDDIEAQGQTDPIPALLRAFDVLSRANRRPGRLVYLLTDADFPDNARVLKTVEQHNKDKRVMINTYLYGDPKKTAVDVMTKIAENNGGRFKVVGYD